MTYTWEYMHITNEIAQGKMTFNDLDDLMAKEDTNYSQDAYRLIYHKSRRKFWKGDVFERCGNTHLFKQF